MSYERNVILYSKCTDKKTRDKTTDKHRNTFNHAPKEHKTSDQKKKQQNLLNSQQQYLHTFKVKILKICCNIPYKPLGR